MARYTKDEYYHRYWELVDLTGCKEKASLMLSIEHNGWDIDKLVTDLDKDFKRRHLSLVKDTGGEE